jgi:hypothetical protein
MHTKDTIAKSQKIRKTWYDFQAIQFKKYPMDNFTLWNRFKFDHESAMMAAMEAYTSDLKYQHDDDHSQRSLDIKPFLPGDAVVNDVVYRETLKRHHLLETKLEQM